MSSSREFISAVHVRGVEHGSSYGMKLSQQFMRDEFISAVHVTFIANVSINIPCVPKKHNKTPFVWHSLT